jgi:(p)ppGpp synthase/HD superfamily hydrolase
MVIRVHDIAHLENVIANLRKVESVINVERTAH